MDGLLLDTESLNERVNGEIVERYGKSFTSDIKIAIAGTTAVNSAQTIIKTLEIPLTIEEYLGERNKLLYPLYPTAKTFPGAVELVQHLAQYNIPQAIASSSSRKNFEMKTVNHQDWLKYFELFTLGDDPEIKQGKPAPDIFLLTAQRLNAQPENCLVFEDSLSGMEAAIAAGMTVVVIPDPVFDKKMFTAADMVLNSMTEFDPQMITS
ncbi:HAD-IA family hydrolase [Waterburya agarophytonicola K14]|uniref:HAD-IA family hydrolase n=2 Tax=Waterburya TaxID=2886915 RepID=A0A964BP57_9CYAN|nr:HAD-IA family hydrolase [Waterburya agarophytonicola KI4]